MRFQYDEELRAVEEEIMNLFIIIEEQFLKVKKIYLEGDFSLLATILEKDDLIDELEVDIEKKVVELIIKQQPIAKDLRKIISFLKMSTDLERMGDHLFDLAKMQIGKKHFSIEKMRETEEIFLLNEEMLNFILKSYLEKDLEKLEKIIYLERKIDGLYREICKKSFKLILAEEILLEEGLDFIFVSRYLERFADHLTNLGEDIIYIEKGARRKLNL